MLSRAPFALVCASLASFASAQTIQLNEIYASHSNPTADIYEFIELKGPANASLANYLVLIVEGDWTATPNHGRLKRVWDLTGHSLSSSGRFVLGEPAVTPAPDLVIDWLGTGQDTLENGTETIYLVHDASGMNVATLVGMAVPPGGFTQVDPDGDLVTTIPGLATIVDIVGLVDGGYLATTNPDVVYDGATVHGPAAPLTSAQIPAGIFRGLDAPNPWCADFLDVDATANLSQPRTPGAVNGTCPSTPPVSVNYCTSGTTTNGCLAVMSSTGVPSVASTSGFVVTCSNVEGAKQGILFYGTSGPVATPWGLGGTSFLCVKSPTQRMGTQNAGGTTNLCDGALSIDLLGYLAANPTALGNPFSAGQQAWLQGWFRDPPSFKTTNLSDGLEITFVP
jgi:hypothetical protein